MLKSIRFFSQIGVIAILIITLSGAAQNLQDDHDGIPKPRPLWKTNARIDEAIGVMTKGQLCNLTMNYGQISDTRLEDPGNRPTDDFFNFRYPKTKPYGSMCDDFSVVFAVEKNSKNGDNGNFIDGYTNNGNEDWIAKDGSLGNTHYDGSGDQPMLLYVDGTTPYLAHSDLPQTWPIDSNGDRFWPGYYRRDPISGAVYEGEFVSDRDVYGVFTDGNNQQGDVIGIEIEQMAYCYGRPYAEDFQFYEFFLHNTSGQIIQGAYFGIYLDPDCSDYAQEILIIPEGHGFNDRFPIIMQRDIKGDINAATQPNPVGRLEDMDFGVIFLETPYAMGITDFHYFTDPGPTFDEQLWPIISSQPQNPNIANVASEYFHGSDPRLDDVSLITTPMDLVFIAATGPFDFPPDITLKFSIAVVVGDTDDDFMNNAQMAIQMFEKGFVGPAAPPGPELWAVPGDGKVTLYWDNSSEQKPDPLTGELDFEGYKIYRSQDNGITWGDPVTDARGVVIGYVPIAQYDLDNTIDGIDPLNSSSYLGSNTGLRYTYVDSSLKNGIAYSYTITAYDRGDPEKNIQSFESAKGVGVAEKNFVTVTPKPDPLAFRPAEIVNTNHTRGKGKGDLNIAVVDVQNYENYLIQNGYTTSPIFKISYEGFPATHFSVYDSTLNNKLLLQSRPLNTETLPVINSIGVSISSSSTQKIGEIKSIMDEMGNDVNGAGKSDHTNSWYVSASTIPPSSIDARSNDYEIRFTTKGAMAYSKGRTPTALMVVPFEVWRIYPDTIQVICEYDDRNNNLTFDENEIIYIGNVPYPAITPAVGDSIAVDFPADFPIQLTFSKVAAGTENPQGGHLPVEGQKVTIHCHVSFSDGSGFTTNNQYSVGDEITFSIQPPSVEKEKIADQLPNIRVVPNPYVVTSLFDPKENVRSIKFMYIPDRCKITIYTISGVKVKEIIHNDGTGIANWDLTNEFNQDISFGVYLYVVSTDIGEKKIGKIAIIK
ncbi:MAG TPA: hypothetical protein ENN22_02465 [bacterium]|nr:hypothetical protein [bacterium]